MQLSRRFLAWALGLGLVCLALWAWTGMFNGLVYDDAYINARFSANLASGHGLTWNQVEKPVEGFTSLLWVALGAAIEFIFAIPPHRSMVPIGIMSWFLLVALAVPVIAKFLVSDRAAPDSRVPRVACLLAILLTPQLALGAFQGMDTALYSLVLALVTLAAFRAGNRLSRMLLVIGSLAAFMTRPDALAFIVPLWAVLFVFSDAAGRSALGRAFAVLLLGLIAYTAAKWQWFGYPLPNTFYIKKGAGFQGIGYVVRYLGSLAPIWLYLAYAIGKNGALRLIRDRYFMQLMIPSLCLCVSYAAMNPVMGIASRFLIPTWPLLVLGILRVETLSESYGMRSVALTRHVVWSVMPNLVFCLTLAMLTMSSWRFMMDDFRTIVDMCSRTRMVNVASGMRLSPAAALVPAPVLATGDIGALAYFSKLKTVDLIGLADARIAHDGLTHDYFQECRPDLIILQDLFLRACSDTVRLGDVELIIDGERRWLDTSLYRSNLKDPAHAHYGLGSTYQVVTLPGFTDLYVHVGHLPSVSNANYFVFMRKEYPRFRELESLLARAGIKKMDLAKGIDRE